MHVPSTLHLLLSRKTYWIIKFSYEFRFCSYPLGHRNLKHFIEICLCTAPKRQNHRASFSSHVVKETRSLRGLFRTCIQSYTQDTRNTIWITNANLPKILFLDITQRLCMRPIPCKHSTWCLAHNYTSGELTKKIALPMIKALKILTMRRKK